MDSFLGAGSQRSLRERNVDLVVRALARLGPLAQADIAEQTTLSHATVSNIVAALTADGRVTVETGKRNGRQAKIVELSQPADGHVSFGLAVGRTEVTGAACDVEGTVLTSVVLPRAPGATYKDELDALRRIVDELRRHPTVVARPLVGAGVSLATWVDFDGGCIPADCDWYGFPAASGWPGAPLREDLRAMLDLAVHVDSDGNADTLAETRWGSARGSANVIYLRVCEGVTGGLLLNDRLYRGERGLAGSLGHSTADPSGRVCICGSRGCLETYLNADMLLEPLRHLHGPALTPNEVAARASQGDDGCARIIAAASERIGTALANVVSALVPQCIVIAGDLAPAGTVLTEGLDRSLRSLMPSMFQPGTIVASRGLLNPAMGGAALAFEEQLWSRPPLGLAAAAAVD